MKYCWIILLLLISAIPVSGGPPEPEPPQLLDLEQELEALGAAESLKALALEESLRIDELIDSRIVNEKLKKILEGIDKGIGISELTIGGDSLIIKLDNDSLVVLTDLDKTIGRFRDKDVVRVGGNIVINEDEVIHGDIVSALGDITVEGTVEGSVLALSGDIYVTPTGNIKGGAVAISGIVKQDEGSHVGTVVWGGRNPLQQRDLIERQPFRIMGYILFLIYIVWMILAATCISLFKKNVTVVMTALKARTVISFLKGYLSYLLIFVAFIVLAITVIGIPLALLGVPIAALAGMILSFTAASVLLGRKILNSTDTSFKTFLYGSLALGLVPGLFFLTLTLTGSLVIMIFSWIFVFIFISIILPTGLGAVLDTRFGTRPPQQAQAENTEK